MVESDEEEKQVRLHVVFHLQIQRAALNNARPWTCI